MTPIARLICADWGKEPKKRAVYEALVAERVVRRVREDVTEVSSLLEYASRGPFPLVLGFDAPIGVPKSFLDAVRRIRPEVTSFSKWLPTASLSDSSSAAAWSIEAPFFGVPAGAGALTRFTEAAAQKGVKLRRKIEERTGGKSVFITAGVPGSVGAAARDVWRGLAAARAGGKRFHLWPFEGELDALLASGVPVVAEIYPRAAYATALTAELPCRRVVLAKTRRATRARALAMLVETRWVVDAGATFEDLGEAESNEDAFDALMTAAALLRCQVQRLPMFGQPLHEPEAEGGILGTGTIGIDEPERTFAALAEDFVVRIDARMCSSRRRRIRWPGTSTPSRDGTGPSTATTTPSVYLGREAADLAFERMDEFHRTGVWRGTFEELRVCLFFQARAGRHSGADPEGEVAERIYALVRALQERPVAL